MINLFISDLHLDEKHPLSADIFFRFMHGPARDADALYILGDFFETWVGDDNLDAFNLRVITALKSATKAGLAIYFQHGNRDFMLGKQFFKASGCELLPEQFVMDLVGRPTLLMHGDTLCIEDIAYLKSRKTLRNKFLQKLFLLRSLKTRQKIAASMRARSKMHTSQAAQAIMDVTQSEVERVMVKHNTLQLIHGHTHRLAVHEFELAGKLARRTVLGSWHEEGNVLVCDDTGKQEFMVLR